MWVSIFQRNLLPQVAQKHLQLSIKTTWHHILDKSPTSSHTSGIHSAPKVNVSTSSTCMTGYAPMRKPARLPSGRKCSCCCAAYVTASSCRADSAPVVIVSSGNENLYHTSVGATLDSEAVSTTGSGCFLPSFTVQQFNKAKDSPIQQQPQPITKIINVVKCHSTMPRCKLTLPMSYSIYSILENFFHISFLKYFVRALLPLFVV